MATNILLPQDGGVKPVGNIPKPIITPNGVPNAIDTGVSTEPKVIPGMKNNLITEDIFLPSKGIVYPYFSGHLKLRAMTTMEERIRLSGQEFWSTMCNVINRCICNPAEDTITAEELTDFDFFAAMVKLRIISYGPEYKTRAQCPKCGKAQWVKIDLDHLAETSVPEGFEEPIILGKLPKSGDEIGIRFLRAQDHIDISKMATEQLQNEATAQLGDPTYTLQMERQIVSINGEPLDSVLTRRYVESMIGMDSNYYHQKIENIFYGIHRVQVAHCDNEECGSPMLCAVAPDSEFFRPSLDD